MVGPVGPPPHQYFGIYFIKCHLVASLWVVPAPPIICSRLPPWNMLSQMLINSSLVFIPKRAPQKSHSHLHSLWIHPRWEICTLMENRSIYIGVLEKNSWLFLSAAKGKSWVDSICFFPLKLCTTAHPHVTKAKLNHQVLMHRKSVCLFGFHPIGLVRKILANNSKAVRRVHWIHVGIGVCIPMSSDF